jgi:hypothetical protein
MFPRSAVSPEILNRRCFVIGAFHAKFAALTWAGISERRCFMFELALAGNRFWAGPRQSRNHVIKGVVS